MITFSQLGRKGRLGNQFFQIASTAGIARKNNHSFFFPTWEYEKYFEYDFPHGKPGPDFIKLKEKQFPFYDWEIGSENYDLDGWLQTERYFDPVLTKKIFSFEPNFEREILQKEKELFNRQTILISVRRGDFVHSNLFFQVPFKYYLLALITYFPGWQQKNLIFASDDIKYCKALFGHLENAFFLEDQTPMEQLVIGTHCDDFIISNSTFSWWIAWLGEKPKSKVICPVKNFRGRPSQPDDRDFYPERWIKLDHRLKFLSWNYIASTMQANLIQVKSFFKFQLRKTKIRVASLLKVIHKET